MPLRALVLVLALGACGSRTGLAVSPTGSRDGGFDAPVALDAGLDAPRALDTGLDAPVALDTGFDAPAPLDASSCGTADPLPAWLWAAQSGTRTAMQRADVRVDTTMWEPIPTVITDARVRVTRAGSAPHLALAGDPAGVAPWYVDNFVLLEVFDCTGMRVGAGFAGFTNGEVTLDGLPLLQLGTNAFDHAAGEITLDDIVPPTGVFSLHATALDNGGWESVSDLFVVAR